MTREGAKGSAAFGEAACPGNELEQGLLALLFETEPLPKLATYLAAVQGAIDDRARVDTQVQARNRASSGAGKRSGYDEKSRAFLGMIHALIPGAGLASQAAGIATELNIVGASLGVQSSAPGA